jgi:tetratricopeptide (TPR) repeat protein
LQTQGIADLVARSLRKTLNRALINPWEGWADYPAPTKEAAERAGYKVFESEAKEPTEVFTLHDRAEFNNLYDSSAVQLTVVILSALGKTGMQQAKPFINKYKPEVLADYYSGRFIFQKGQQNEAQSRFEVALAADATFFPAKIGLARCRELAGDRRQAQELLMDAARLDTGSTEAMLALGEFFLRGFEWNGAESALKVVLARDPLNARAMVGLTHIHPDRLKDLRLNTSLALAEEATRLDPGYEEARIVWADQLFAKGFLPKAIKILEQGLNINPDSQELTLKLAGLEIQRGNPDKARSLYTGILKREPDNALVNFNLGVVQYHAKEYDAAMQTFRLVQSLNGPADCLYYMGMIYQIKGDPENARFYFQKRWEKRTGDDDEFGQRAARKVAQIDGKAVDGK